LKLVFHFQGTPEGELSDEVEELSDEVEELPRFGGSVAPEDSGPKLIKPFLVGEGIMLDAIPGSLSSFLYHYRDDFIAWIDPHVSKAVGRVLLELYNQVLEQLEVELDLAKECLEATSSLERRWVKTIISMADRRATLETENNQKFADLQAERDEARRDLAALRETFDAFSTSSDERFEKLTVHFNEASARVRGLDEDLVVAREQLKTAQVRVRELETSNAERFRRCEQLQEQCNLHRRSLDKAEGEVRTLRRRLEEADRNVSFWKHAHEKARRR
jgi:DNA repair exonuclease SbcCD ATPase subunit